MRLPPEPAAAAEARSAAREALAGRVPPEVLSDVQLVVSELVTNAVLHGAPPIELELSAAADAVEVRVIDAATSRRPMLNHAPDAEGGQGLRIVAALADAFGVDVDAGGTKVVWCRLPATGVSSHRRDGERVPRAARHHGDRQLQ